MMKTKSLRGAGGAAAALDAGGGAAAGCRATIAALSSTGASSSAAAGGSGSAASSGSSSSAAITISGPSASPSGASASASRASRRATAALPAVRWSARTALGVSTGPASVDSSEPAGCGRATSGAGVASVGGLGTGAVAVRRLYGARCREREVRTRTSVQQGGEAAGVRALEVDQRDRQHALDVQDVAADLADHPRGGAERLQRFGVAGDDERARALAEQ